MDEETTVLEAGLGWMVGWDKAEFVGHEALREQKVAGVGRRLAGFEMVDRGIARPGYPVRVDGEVVGKVTSGTQTPFVKKAIGMAYLPAARAKADTEFDVEIRGRWARAKVVKMPFYKRQGS
jgi:aminomethyltransferase